MIERPDAGSPGRTGTDHPRGRSASPAATGTSDDLDPSSALTAIGEIVYRWDLGSDALHLGANAVHLFGALALNLTSGAARDRLRIDGSGRTSGEAIDAAVADAGLHGPAPDHLGYRTRYVLRTLAGQAVSVEESGRISLHDGRPCSAHGVWRVRPAGAFDLSVRGHRQTPRQELLARLSHDLGLSAPPDIAVLTVTLTEAASVIERHGDAGIDAIMAEVQRRLAQVVRGGDLLILYTQQRFGLVLGACPAAQIPAVVERFAAVAAGPVVVTGESIPARLEIGAAAPLREDTPESLLRRAEQPAGPMPSAARPGAASETLIAALNERRLVLALQPVAEANGGQIAFHEALARIATEDGTIIPAGAFVPMAERSGLISLMDHRVLELAASHLSAHPEARLSVNISPLTLADPVWLDLLAGLLGRSPGIAERLIVEITETAAVGDPDAFAGRLRAIKALGPLLALDDFGAGHTSFRQLRQWPVDLVKIDGAFIRALEQSADDRFFVRTLIDLAQNLGIATVAEWVDGEAAARLLRGWGVDYLQGNLIGRPELDLPQGRAAQAACPFFGRR